jgi:hypothetical protein
LPAVATEGVGDGAEDAAADDDDELAVGPAGGDAEQPATSPTARNRAAARAVEEITRRVSPARLDAPLPASWVAPSGRVNR